MLSTDGLLPKRMKTDQMANDVYTTSILPHLNDECLVAIVQWLPLKKKIQFERVSQCWRDDIIPKSFSNETSLQLDEFFSNFTNGYGRLRGWQIFKSLIHRTGKHLITLNMSSCNRDVQFLRPELLLLARKCLNLRHLHINAKTASRFALLQIGTQLNQLESLHVKGVYDLDRQVALAFYASLGFGISSMANLKRFASDGTVRGAFLRSLPDSIISLKCCALYPSERNDLVEFLRSHAGFEQFEVDFDRVVYHNPLLLAPTLLAQYCSGLTSLRIGATGDYLESTATAFADALRSLTQLKQLYVQLNHNFTDSVLQSLCCNCPNLEVLQIGDYNNQMMAKRKDLTLTGLMHIGELKKLRCLEIHWLNCDISDQFVTELCGASGATLEELKFNSNSLTDASLLQLAVSCGNLVFLDVSECRSFTEAGVKNFVEAIASQQSRMDRRKIRHLHMIVSTKLYFTVEYSLSLFVRQSLTLCLTMPSTLGLFYNVKNGCPYCCRIG